MQIILYVISSILPTIAFIPTAKRTRELYLRPPFQTIFTPTQRHWSAPNALVLRKIGGRGKRDKNALSSAN